MKKYAGFRNGYVRVRIYGEQTERFLNLCRAREIRISDLRRESELSLTGCLQIRDFFRLAPNMDCPSFFTEVKRERLFFLDYFYVQDCFCSCPDGCGKLM